MADTKVKPKPKPLSIAQQLQDAATTGTVPPTGATGETTITQPGGFNIAGITAGSGAGSAAAEGLAASKATIPAVFSFPGSKEGVPLPSLKGGTTGKEGQVTGTAQQIMDWLYNLNAAQLRYVEIQLADGGWLTTPKITSGVNTTVRDAFLSVIEDAANSGQPVLSYLDLSTHLGSPKATSDYVNKLYSQEATIQGQLTSPQVVGYTSTDPNKITDALDAAYASIGAGQPPPGLVDAFITNFHAAEAAAPTAEAGAEKSDRAAQLSGLQADIANASTATPGQLTQMETTPGPIAAAGKPTPDLDAEAMAQAKASDPGQYYATQSSYLYGLLAKVFHGGLPAYQTAPTAPSGSAPGGANLGTPLVGAT